MTGHGKKATATRKRLLDAALEVMSRKGYTEATVEEIAQEAGVSKGLAYYHFKSKSEMATEMLENVIEEFVMNFERIAAESSNAKEALDSMLNYLADYLARNGRFCRFYFSELWRDGRVWSEEMRGIESRLIAVISSQIQRGIDDGELRAEIDAEFAAVACIGLSLTAAMRYYGMTDDEHPSMEKDIFVDNVVDAVHHMLSDDV